MNRKLLYKLAEITKTGETSEGRQMLAALRQVSHDLANRHKRSSKQQSAVPLVNKWLPKTRMIDKATTKTNKTHENKTTSDKKNSAPHAVVPVLTFPLPKKQKQQPNMSGNGSMRVTGNATKAHGCPTCAGGVGGNNAALNSALAPVGNQCAGCPGVGRQTNPLDLIKQLTRTIDLVKCYFISFLLHLYCSLSNFADLYYHQALDKADKDLTFMGPLNVDI